MHACGDFRIRASKRSTVSSGDALPQAPPQSHTLSLNESTRKQAMLNRVEIVVRQLEDHHGRAATFDELAQAGNNAEWSCLAKVPFIPYAASTLHLHHSVWGRYIDWCKAHDIQSAPLLPAHVAKFLQNHIVVVAMLHPRCWAALNSSTANVGSTQTWTTNQL